MPIITAGCSALGLDLAGALDPAVMMSERGYQPDAWQQRLLREQASRVLVLAGRQVGKSEAAVTRGHSVMKHPPIRALMEGRGANIGVLAPGLRQSTKLLRRIRRAFEADSRRSVAAGLGPGIVPVNASVTSLILSNGSEATAWPGSKPDLIRGDGLDLLIVDEGAWVLDEAFAVCLPMLAVSGGSVLIATSPGGPAGFVYDVWENRDGAFAGWDRVKVRADECARYTPEVLRELRAALGTRAASELDAEWREADDAVFTAEQIARFFGDPVPDVLDGEEALPDDEDPGAVEEVAGWGRVINLADAVARLRARQGRAS